MQYILVSLDIVVPFLLLMAVGYLLRVLKILNETIINGINKIVTMVLLPCRLFNNLYVSDFSQGINGKLYLYCVGAILLSIVVFALALPRIEPVHKRAGTMLHALFRGNTAIFGIPLIHAILGEGNAGDTILLTSVVIVLYNVIGVIVLIYYSGREHSFLDIVRDTLLTPMIIGAFIGFLCAVTPVRLPGMVYEPIQILASAATPFACMALGGAFHLNIERINRRVVAGVTIIKMVLYPALWIFLGVFVLGFRDSAATALVAIFAAPTAVSTNAMAYTYDLDATLAGELVVFTTAASVVTLFLCIVVLKSLAIF